MKQKKNFKKTKLSQKKFTRNFSETEWNTFKGSWEGNH